MSGSLGLYRSSARGTKGIPFFSIFAEQYLTIVVPPDNGGNHISLPAKA
jgi:hypothetical protein